MGVWVCYNLKINTANERGIIVDRKCVKCETILTKSVALVGGDGNFVACKAPCTELKNKKTVTEIRPYICSNCGYVEWYVDKPENFK
jgi:predicted nucleic-acid-binding Zn-ribbon protein